MIFLVPVPFFENLIGDGEGDDIGDDSRNRIGDLEADNGDGKGEPYRQRQDVGQEETGEPLTGQLGGGDEDGGEN